MGRKFWILYLMVFIPIFIFASNLTQQPEFSNPDKPIIVQKDSPTFTIKLPANPTTGYSWFLLYPMDKMLAPMGQVYHRPEKTMSGAGGYDEWLFKVNPEGFTVPQITSLTLIYARPWELTEAKKLTFRIVTHG